MIVKKADSEQQEVEEDLREMMAKTLSLQKQEE